MSARKQAIQMYEQLKDMDFWDYAESYEDDINYLTALIENLGASDTLSFLGYF